MSNLFTVDIDRGAVISQCGLYRYHLWRVWDKQLPILAFVMLNPSKADAEVDDPTIRRCLGFARRDGYGGISVRNVFALRATNPADLLCHPDPVGPDNEQHLAACRAPLLTRFVVAWGSRFGGERLRSAYKSAAVVLAVQKPYCLGVTKSGDPRHPVRLRTDAEMVPWKIPENY